MAGEYIDTSTGIIALSTELGNAWNAVSTATTAPNLIDAGIKVVTDSMNNTYLDDRVATGTLLNTILTQKNGFSAIEPYLKAMAVGLETYIQATHSMSFRKWFDTAPNQVATLSVDNWTAFFRTLWRTAKTQELAGCVNTFVVGGAVAPGPLTATVNSPLQIRGDTATPLISITSVTCVNAAGTSTVLNFASAPLLVAGTYDSTNSATYANLTGNYVSVSSITATGLGGTVQVWVSPTS